MKVNLDYEVRNEKPKKRDTAIITKRLFNEENYVDISFNDFVSAISEKGQAFSAGHLVGGAKTENWESQYIFCLDMETDKKTGNNLKMEEAIDILKEYHIIPNIIYKTFSHTETEHRYRIVWILNEVITDIRMFNFIQRALVRFFSGKGVDTGCVNCNRIFNGSNKGCFYSNENNRLSVPNLFNALEMLFRKDNNATKNTKNFAQKVGVNLINGYLDCKVCSKNDIDFSNDNIYYSNNKNLEENYYVNFTPEYTINGNKMEIENCKTKNNLIRNFNFDELAENCRYYKEVMEGKIWLDHNSLFYFLTNILQAEGGVKKAEELVDVIIEETKKQEYHEKENYIRFTINQFNKKGAYATPCSCIGCPYYGECKSDSNMMVFNRINDKTKETTITSKVKTDIKVREIEEVREDLVNVFKNFFNDEDRFVNTMNAWDAELSGEKIEQDIWFCKAPTGIGKTETFIQEVRNYIEDGVLYCAPTHKLIKDVARRLKKAGFEEDIDFMCIPELPDFKERTYIEKLYQVGAYTAAALELRDIAENNKEVKDYLEKKKQAENFNKLVLTTHSRAIVSKMRIKPRYVIFDEDVILSTLANFNSIKIEELYNAGLEIAQKDIKDSNLIVNYYNIVNKAEDGIINRTPMSVIQDRKSLTKEISNIANTDKLESNILDFINSYCFSKIDNVIYYCVKRDFSMLPMNSKILVLSATIDKQISLRMFPNAKWLDLGIVKNVGQLFQVPSKSLSKYCFYSNKKGCEMYTKKLCEKYLGKDYNIITFPEFLNNEKNEIEKTINLRNCSGIDNLKNKDLAVIGTPHVPPIIYYLFSYILDYNYSAINDCKYTLVNRNGFVFKFNTYSDNPYLMNIQFYLIDSALLQCVGRARLINNEKRRVLVLSNYLLPQAIVFNYNKNEVKELMN